MSLKDWTFTKEAADAPLYQTVAPNIKPDHGRINLTFFAGLPTMPTKDVPKFAQGVSDRAWKFIQELEKLLGGHTKVNSQTEETYVEPRARAVAVSQWGYVEFEPGPTFYDLLDLCKTAGKKTGWKLAK